MRLIDADALAEVIEDMPWYSLYKGCMINGAKDEVGAWYKAVDIIAVLNNAPTIEAEPVKRWRETCESLPEQGKDVLMYFDTGNMAVGFWHDRDEDITFWCAWTDDGWYTDCDCEPVAWMPLPEQPNCGAKMDLED